MSSIPMVLITKVNMLMSTVPKIFIQMTRVSIVLVLALSTVFYLPIQVSASTDTTYYPISQGVGTAGEMTVGPDDNVWFLNGCPGNACSGSSPFRIVRMTASGVLTTFADSSVPRADITVGPDEALWYTQGSRFNSAIGRITTNGSVTEYSIPADPGTNRAPSPGKITLGPDGALWFTLGVNSFEVPSVGRISTSGEITNFPLTTLQNRQLNDIVSGSDGALWFTVPFDNSIGRLTTSGALTLFPLPSGNVGPNNDGATNITLGSDGALWFTMVNANKIGRITTEGIISEYPIVNNNQPMYITSGSDGNIWFNEPTARNIARLDISTGAVSEYNITPNDGGTIISGPDGDIWFGRSIGDQLGWSGYVGHFNPLTIFKPEAPTNLAALSPTKVSPVLSWDTVIDAESYNVYANNTLVDNTSSTTYTDTTTGQGSIHYHVTTVGPGGTESDPSEAIVVVHDISPPAIDYSVVPTPNGTAWNNTSTTVTFNCTDSLSGVSSCSSPVVINNEGENQQVVGTAVDQAGNTATVSATVNVDKTVPTVSRPTTSNRVLLFAGKATISAEATDSLSGVVSGEYFNGTDPGQGMGTPMSYVSGKITASVNVPGSGTTTYSMRSKDAAGNWSSIVTIPIFVIF